MTDPSDLLLPLYQILRSQREQFHELLLATAALAKTLQTSPQLAQIYAAALADLGTEDGELAQAKRKDLRIIDDAIRLIRPTVQ